MTLKDDASKGYFKPFATDEIPGLDGLRAISVLLVMAAHYSDSPYVPGGLGVTIFFFISGFLITSLLYRETTRASSISLRDFYVRRILRVQPELLAFLALSAAIGPLYNETASDGEVAAAVFNYTNYQRILSSTTDAAMPRHWIQLWSLAVEEHYYLVYPVLFLIFYKKPKRMLQILIAVCAMTLAWRCILAIGRNNEFYISEASDTRIDSIIYGCILSIVVLHFPARTSVMDRLAPILMPVGLTLLLSTLAFRQEYFRDTFRYSLQGIALFLIVLAMLTPVGRRQTSWLSSPTISWVGRMSYAAYLWQFVPLDLIRHYLPIGAERTGFIATCAVGLTSALATFLLAALSHRFIYQPLLVIRRQFGSHRIADFSPPKLDWMAPARHASESSN